MIKEEPNVNFIFCFFGHNRRRERVSKRISAWLNPRTIPKETNHHPIHWSYHTTTKSIIKKKKERKTKCIILLWWSKCKATNRTTQPLRLIILNPPSLRISPLNEGGCPTITPLPHGTSLLSNQHQLQCLVSMRRTIFVHILWS